MSRCTVRLVPNFDVNQSNFDVKKYQIRKTQRTDDDIKKLKFMIENQGQVEPIQVVKEGDTYCLIAGAGRVQCLQELGMCAKALVYEGLTHDEIIKIAVGTNEARVEMSAWDRIASIGEYIDNTMSIDPYDTEDMISVAELFGRRVNILMRDYDLWAFYKEIPEFVELFNSKSIPSFVITSVDDILNPYKDKIYSYSYIVSIVESILATKNLTATMFTNMFIKKITEYLVNINVSNTDTDGMTSEEISDVEKFTRTRLIMKSRKEKEKIDTEDNNIRLKCEKVMNLLLKQCQTVIDTMEKLKKLPYKTKLSSDYMLKLSRIITKINHTGIKLL